VGRNTIRNPDVFPARACPAWRHRRSTMAVLERIQAEVDAHPVVLFMKGTPQFPMCGFSSRTVEVLKAAGASGIHTINVLEDPEIRANLPRFSNWPTFPQLFIHGELIGGCDITLELHESGELARMIAEVQSA
jgi:monothiol glutaredoxin